MYKKESAEVIMIDMHKTGTICGNVNLKFTN